MKGPKFSIRYWRISVTLGSGIAGFNFTRYFDISVKIIIQQSCQWINSSNQESLSSGTSSRSRDARKVDRNGINGQEDVQNEWQAVSGQVQASVNMTSFFANFTYIFPIPFFAPLLYPFSLFRRGQRERRRRKHGKLAAGKRFGQRDWPGANHPRKRQKMRHHVKREWGKGWFRRWV